MSLRPLIVSLCLILGVTPAPWAAAQSIRLPDIGDPSQAYFGPDQEQKLGLEIMRKLRERDLVLDDVPLNEYLNSVGQSIVTYADQHSAPYTFFMVRDASINAFALPQNFIGVNVGLLLTTQREDELAGVLAHEIAHVSQHHIVRAIADQQRLTLPMAAAMLAGVALAATSKQGGQVGQAAMVGSLAAGAQHQISFTRANEQEADRIGLSLLARAGFDPRGLTDFFARLERLSSGEACNLERRSSGEACNQVPDMLLTHPRPEIRLADTQDRVNIPSIQRNAVRDRKAYDLAKARVMVLATEDNQSLIRKLETLLAKGDAGSETANRYAYVLVLRQAGRYDEASQQLARLLRNDPDRLAFRIEAAEIALAKGDQAQSGRLFAEARQLYPDDFTLAMYYGRAAITLGDPNGDPKLAMRLLQPHLRRRPNDAQLYGVYAQAAQRAGDMAATYATMAEYHYLNGELLPAIEQLELGLRNPGLSPNQESQLQARLKQFMAEAIDQDLPVSKKKSP